MSLGVCLHPWTVIIVKTTHVTECRVPLCPRWSLPLTLFAINTDHHTLHKILFLSLKDLLISLKDKVTEIGDREPSHLLVHAQMATAAGAKPCQSQECGILSGFPTMVAGAVPCFPGHHQRAGLGMGHAAVSENNFIHRTTMLIPLTGCIHTGYTGSTHTGQHGYTQPLTGAHRLKGSHGLTRAHTGSHGLTRAHTGCS